MSNLRMTFEEILAKANANPPRKRPAEEEHRIQCACVKWFRLAHSSMAHNLFSVPNGGRRDKTTAAKLKAEGLLPGVSDLILLVPNNDYHALLIEMKTRTGRQADVQREWQQQMEYWNYKYVVCRSIEDFMREINDYLNG